MSETPTRIGPYAIERRLGAGGMAETFVAVRRMQTIEQRVCLKRILPAYAKDATARRLFHREANISARLRHANLVPVLDVADYQGTPYLVMELVEGVDLDHVLERQPDHRLPPELVGYLLSEIAHGLHEAHGGDGAHEGVVHRDLSPSNVLLSTQGEVKVADFGIAKALSGGDKATATMMRGKFAYMAPEQLDGAALDPRADMFALGVIGFEMLAGVRPFDADADARLVLLIAKNERRPIHELAPDAPQDLRDTIEALLSHRREERPATGHEVVERLAPMLPAAVVARRQLGKLVTAAYEARLEALSREPATPPPMALDEALAATQMASPHPSTTPSTRPAPIRAAATPMVVTALPEGPGAEPVTERSSGPVASAARAGRSPWVLVAGGLAVAALLAVTATGAYVVLGRESGEGGDEVATAGGAGSETGSEGESEGESEARRAAPATTAVVVPATTTVAAPPAPTRIAARPPPPSTTVHHAPPASDAPASPTGEGADAREASGRGRVHVVVSPWGLVWIDGRYVGRAPVHSELRAGSHRIAAGFVEPTTTRTIRVHAGGEERVELEVESH